MSTIIYNDCGVTTILPLGVECYSVNSSTPDSNDGRIYLTITGGSSPYSITWSNGLKDQNIKNLLVALVGVSVTDKPVMSLKVEEETNSCVSVLVALTTCNTVPAGILAFGNVPTETADALLYEAVDVVITVPVSAGNV